MEKRIIANIKSLGIDMINEAGSGHPGIVLGAAPIIYTLFANHININPSDSKWPNRDRFILSAGHGSALLYATLYMAGFNVKIDDLKKFRRIGSITPGHPEYDITPGVEASTGPLGQGFANAVGIAIGEKMLENNNEIFDYKVYVLCSDGDLMEGISNEAASLAGTLRLNNLIVLYDSNNVSLDGPTTNTFYENVLERFRGLGWYTEYVADGEDTYSIDRAISRAKEADKPAIIEIKTIIGKGSIYEGTNTVHGKILEKNDIEGIKSKIKFENEPFYVDSAARSEFMNMIKNRSSEKYNKWVANYSDLTENNNLIDLTTLNWDFSKPKEMRSINNDIMNVIADHVDNFIGGSADLATSAKTYLKNYGDFTSNNYSGRNLLYGVREHAMSAISNGLALTGFRPFASTFLVFSDYLKPALRLSALMGLPVTYIFSHDSVAIGSDGPTHQPVEQLSTLRATPNLNVFRPADAKELLGTWNYILRSNNAPNALIVSKQEVPTLEVTDINKVSNGAYIVRKEIDYLHGIVLSTGTEVHTALKVANELYEKYKLDLRVVSMPSMELFLLMDEGYQKSIIPDGYRTIVIEAGSSFGWHRFVYNDKYMITIDKFGASGTSEEIIEMFNFNHDKIKERIIELFK